MIFVKSNFQFLAEKGAHFSPLMHVPLLIMSLSCGKTEKITDNSHTLAEQIPSVSKSKEVMVHAMRESRHFRQRGSNFDNVFFFVVVFLV